MNRQCGNLVNYATNLTNIIKKKYKCISLTSIDLEHQISPTTFHAHRYAGVLHIKENIRFTLQFSTI